MGALKSLASSEPRWPEAPEGLVIVAHQDLAVVKGVVVQLRSFFKATWIVVYDCGFLVWGRSKVQEREGFEGSDAEFDGRLQSRLVYFLCLQMRLENGWLVKD